MSATLTRQVVVRIDDSLLWALTEDAETHGRTIAQSIRFHLRRALLTETNETQS